MNCLNLFHREVVVCYVPDNVAFDFRLLGPHTERLNGLIDPDSHRELSVLDFNIGGVSELSDTVQY